MQSNWNGSQTSVFTWLWPALPQPQEAFVEAALRVDCAADGIAAMELARVGAVEARDVVAAAVEPTRLARETLLCLRVLPPVDIVNVSICY